jgi:hypothetical protein
MVKLLYLGTPAITVNKRYYCQFLIHTVKQVLVNTNCSCLVVMLGGIRLSVIAPDNDYN